MMTKNYILARTLQYLAGRTARRRLVDLRLTRYFTTAELDDGSVGACMSYYRLPDQVLDQVEARLKRCYEHDLFLLPDDHIVVRAIADCVVEELQRYYVSTSVAATIASALSAVAIRNADDPDFEVKRQRPQQWVRDSESALVVGFGGLLEHLTAEPTIKRVHVIDLLYHPNRNRFQARLSELRSRFPNKCVTASSGVGCATYMRTFDFVCISGSTLCNGTLEDLLASIRRNSIVILQGQSASVHPRILFQSGVSWVATTLKPQVLSQMASQDHSGNTMRPLLEGGLSPIYLLPREPPESAIA